MGPTDEAEYFETRDEVLERAGIRRSAVDVMPQGLDATVVSGGVDQGHVRRPLPVAKALDDALLAYEQRLPVLGRRPAPRDRRLSPHRPARRPH